MEASTGYCLNCNHFLSGKYCSNCGQKADTKRISIKHFLQHDLVHGVFHVEKGMLFTLKEAILRPGMAAKNYIIGKRVIYYNVFYLSLLLVGLNLLVLHYLLKTSSLEIISSGDMDAISAFLQNNVKIILLMFIPVISIWGYIIFRKNKFNIAEHAIIAGFLFCGFISLRLLRNLLLLFPEGVENVLKFSLLPVIALIQFLLPAWTYYKAVSDKYTKLGFLWRIVVMYVAVIVCYLIILAALLLIFNYMQTGKWEMEGELNLK